MHRGVVIGSVGVECREQFKVLRIRNKIHPDVTMSARNESFF